MIFVTGDTHGDFSRFSMKNFQEQKNLTKKDYVIICGDFGGIWSDSDEEKYWLNWLNEKSFTILFVDGNHENYTLLNNYPVHEWNGGNVHFIRDNIIHLMRGQVFNIDGFIFFSFGGASSHDIFDGILEKDEREKIRTFRKMNKLFRINNVSWWKDELPNEQEYKTALKNLKKHNNKVDYIIGHCCPSKIVDIIGQGFYEHDELTDFFDLIDKTCNFKYFFFGHYHDNRIFNKRYILLHKMIISMNDNLY